MSYLAPGGRSAGPTDALVASDGTGLAAAAASRRRRKTSGRHLRQPCWTCCTTLDLEIALSSQIGSFDGTVQLMTSIRQMG